jgi:hypothetical protein
MQVRPPTADMMGFKGSAADLTDPATNIHLGVRYLASAWRLAGSAVCRALTKYRAGHGEKWMSPLSATYWQRARSYLLRSALRSRHRSRPTCDWEPLVPEAGLRMWRAASFSRAKPRFGADAAPVQGPEAIRTARDSLSPWAVHEARVRAIRSRMGEG